jgi:hypothetical protein
MYAGGVTASAGAKEDLLARLARMKALAKALKDDCAHHAAAREVCEALLREIDKVRKKLKVLNLPAR